MGKRCEFAIKNIAGGYHCRRTDNHGFPNHKGLWRAFCGRIKSQEGSVTPIILMKSIVWITFFVLLFTLVYTNVSLKKDKYYDWVGGAMEFAADASVLGTSSESVVFLEGVAQEYFKLSLAGMVEGTVSGNSIIPGKGGIPGYIEIEEFVAVQPGDPIPAGTAEQYGYVVKLEFPLLNTKLPLMGDVNLSTPLSYYAVAKGTEK